MNTLRILLALGIAIPLYSMVDNLSEFALVALLQLLAGINFKFGE